MRIDLNGRDVVRMIGCFLHLRMNVAKLAIEQCRQFACDADMRQAIATITRHLDIDDGVVPVPLDDFDRQPLVRKCLGGLLAFERAGRY